MKTNPFKFGTVVDGEFFTNREEESTSLKSYLKSQNHLVLASPRRYGKTSLVYKVVKETGRPFIFLDLQLITSIDDFAAQLLKRIYRLFPLEKLKKAILSFRIIPSLSVNPTTGEIDVSFQSGKENTAPLEDVLQLLEKLSTPGKKLIVVFDEFQEIIRIHDGLERTLRSVMQQQTMINYIFLGSRESLIREIFQKKKSPFYHFAYLIQLNRIPEDKFREYLDDRFKLVSSDHKKITEDILQFTQLHPYYTQQLAFSIWELLVRNDKADKVFDQAIQEILRNHDYDYERLWNNLNRTDMKVLIGLALSTNSPYSVEFARLFGTGVSSTVHSSLKRLTENGLLIRIDQNYFLDDPFFKRWIEERRSK